MENLGRDMILMTGAGNLLEIGASQEEVDIIMEDQMTALAGLLNMGDPHQWAMMQLTALRSVLSVAEQPDMEEPL